MPYTTQRISAMASQPHMSFHYAIRSTSTQEHIYVYANLGTTDVDLDKPKNHISEEIYELLITLSLFEILIYQQRIFSFFFEILDHCSSTVCSKYWPHGTNLL